MKKMTMKNRSFVEAMNMISDENLIVTSGKGKTEYTVGKIFSWDIMMETNKGPKYVKLDFADNTAEEALAMINVFCYAMEARSN